MTTGTGSPAGLGHSIRLLTSFGWKLESELLTLALWMATAKTLVPSWKRSLLIEKGS